MLYGSLNIDIILVLVKIISNYFIGFVAILNRLTSFSFIAGYIKYKEEFINVCLFMMYTATLKVFPLRGPAGLAFLALFYQKHE